MRRSLRRRQHEDTDGALPRMGTGDKEQNQDMMALEAPTPIRRRRLRNSSVPAAAVVQMDRPLESVFQQRMQELLEMHQASQSDDRSSLQLRYMDLDALQQTQKTEETEQNHLFFRICADGRLECFQLEGWTDISLATQPAPPLEPFLTSSDLQQGLMSMQKKRKTRAHVLAPGSLSLIPFGEDERLTWTKRIFQFIAKMRRVLGDRRISFPWGGSIVDSIIGVYITQNVSDTFSSKAFMNIAAKFPSLGARSDRCDIVDWKRVLQQPLSELSACIECRGMQNVLAHRIMKFLKQVEDGVVWRWWCEEEAAKQKTSDRTASPEQPFAEVIRVLEQLQAELNPPPDPELLGYMPGEVSLEWMRRLDCDSVTEILTKNLEGFGEKSAACVTLLCFHWKSFPVDVNVARICARLGWIPLKTAEKIEEMDLYAPELEVHKYLKARLSHFDFDTLYELHYLMITMGKVFCTKSTPRCNACPLRNKCEYACSGGRRFEKLVPIKQPKRQKRAVEDQSAHMETTVKGNQARKSSEAASEFMQSEDPSTVYETPKKNLEALHRSHQMSSDITDIEDIVPNDRRHLHDSVTSIASRIRRAKLRSKESEGSSAKEAKSRTSTTEISRILEIYNRNQASTSEANNRMMEGSYNEVQGQIFCKDVAAQILDIDRDTEEHQARTRYKHLSKLIHPDKCREEDANTAFTVLSQAYQVITQTSKPADSASSSTEAAEDEETESFVVSRLPIAIRTPLTFTHSRNILHAFRFPDFSPVLPFLPTGIPDLGQSPIFLLPDPRKHSWTDRREAGDADWSIFAMISAKDAMDSRFPLNGTFFQTNELFLIDGHAFQIPAWCLLSAEVSIVRVYFGTSVSRITLGMGTAEVTHLFNRSFVCVRNFSFETRQATKLHPFLTP